MARRLGGVLLVAALLLALLPVTPASATSAYLCSSYDGCQDAGYRHFGYERASRHMWWRMYAGHNCTNYVAYRLVRGGMSADRPWAGSGMAYNWGHAKRGITDRRPMVGSVAWWDRNVPGAGSSGHVAYVEKVLSRTRIIVSEDSWGGTFHWRRLTKAGSGWPTGFIHFADREVRPRTGPAVTGDPVVGGELVATAGTWSPEAVRRLQWLADGVPIAGATARRFSPTAAHRGTRLAVRVKATSRGYVPGVAVSAPTARVGRGTLTVTAAPTVSGTARVGEVLHLVPGSWAPAPGSTAVRWFAGGDRIRGASALRLRVVPGLVGRKISARMSARLEGYRRSGVSSAPTPAVRRGRITLRSPFAVAGRARMGERLTVVPGSAEPADATVSYAWLRNGTRIEGATGRRYLLGVEDVGDRIALRVALARTGYRDRKVLVEGGRVTTAPVLSLNPVGRPRAVVVRLRVTAPGVRVPGGSATVRVAGRQVTGRLEDGRLRVVLRDIAPGTRTVRVAYGGTGVVRAGRASATVEVPRR